MFFFKHKKRPNSVKCLTNSPLNTTTDPTFAKNLKAYISHYCDTTTIHGVKYIGEKGRYLIEKFGPFGHIPDDYKRKAFFRLVWVFVVTTICSVCILLIDKMYHKWESSPVIVSFETKETSIFEIPFPAVTVCPEVKFDPDYFNFTESYLKKLQKINLTEREETLFDTALLSCDERHYYKETFGTENNRKFMGENFYQELFLSAGDLYYDDNVTTAQFIGKDVTHLLATSITQEGVCYTFNMLPIHEISRNKDRFVKANPDVKVRKWSLEDGYPPGDNLDSYPKRTFMSGLDGGLVFDGLYANHSQLDYLCQGGVQGFKIVLHHPSEYPNMDKHFILPLDHVVLVAIKPSMITVSKELLSYDPKDRKCYFSQEKYLSMYKHYTQENCLVECLSNFTLKSCGCLSFWMPSLTGTKICGPGQTQCVKNSKIDYLSYNNRNQKGVDQCECLPACTSLSYDIETSQTNWNWRKMDELYEFVNASVYDVETDLSHFSKLLVYYKDLQFLTSRRHELYGVVDFVSNVGGLLGLFVGFSVISAIEIIHFVSLRIMCNVRKYGKKFWSGEVDLMKN